MVTLCNGSQRSINFNRKRHLCAPRDRFLRKLGTRKWRQIRGEVDQDTGSSLENRLEMAVNNEGGMNPFFDGEESTQLTALLFDP